MYLCLWTISIQRYSVRPCHSSNSTTPSSTPDTATLERLLAVAAIVAPIAVSAVQALPQPELWIACHLYLINQRGVPRLHALRPASSARVVLAWAGNLPDIPNCIIQRCSRCREEGHNVLNCRALPEGMQLFGIPRNVAALRRVRGRQRRRLRHRRLYSYFFSLYTRTSNLSHSPY